MSENVAYGQVKVRSGDQEEVQEYEVLNNNMAAHAAHDEVKVASGDGEGAQEYVVANNLADTDL